uniref:Uncharacterized protein n=1 Tax=Anguilla anguilla TaxID=7936 RepID=A0A0E9PKI0_ANGAN
MYKEKKKLFTSNLIKKNLKNYQDDKAGMKRDTHLVCVTHMDAM